MSWLLGLIPDSLQKYPKLICLIFGCFVVYAFYSNYTYAGKVYVDNQITSIRDEIHAIKSDVAEFRKQSKIDTLLQRIADMDAEIYQLQRLERSGEANNRDIDRLIMLISSHDEAERQLRIESR